MYPSKIDLVMSAMCRGNQYLCLFIKRENTLHNETNVGQRWPTLANEFHGPSIEYSLVNIQKAIEKMSIEIVDFPMKNCVIFHSYVSLTEGKYPYEDSLYNQINQSTSNHLINP